MYSVRTHWPHQSRLQSQKLTSIENHRNPHFGKKCWTYSRGEKSAAAGAARQYRFGACEVLSDRGDATKDDADADESSCESTDTMPSLPLVSRFKDTRTSRHAKVRCWKYLKPRNCNGRRDEESPLFDYWEGRQEHSDTLQRLDPWTLFAPMSLSSVKISPADGHPFYVEFAINVPDVHGTGVPQPLTALVDQVHGLFFHKLVLLKPVNVLTHRILKLDAHHRNPDHQSVCSR